MSILARRRIRVAAPYTRVQSVFIREFARIARRGRDGPTLAPRLATARSR
jgi:hypothetical protein